MLYTDLLERKPPGSGARLGAFLVIISTLVLFVAGILIGPEQLFALIDSESTYLKCLVYSPPVILLLLGLFLL